MPKKLSCNISVPLSNVSTISDSRKMHAEILFDGDIVVLKTEFTNSTYQDIGLQDCEFLGLHHSAEELSGVILCL